jgi:hypothetical protein
MIRPTLPMRISARLLFFSYLLKVPRPRPNLPFLSITSKFQHQVHISHPRLDLLLDVACFRTHGNSLQNLMRWFSPWSRFDQVLFFEGPET